MYWNHNRKIIYHLPNTNWIIVQTRFSLLVSVCSLTQCCASPVPRKAFMGWSQIKLFSKFVLLIDQILCFMLGWAMYMPSQPWHAGLGSSGRHYPVLIISGNPVVQWCSCLSKTNVTLQTPWRWDYFILLYHTFFPELNDVFCPSPPSSPPLWRCAGWSQPHDSCFLPCINSQYIFPTNALHARFSFATKMHRRWEHNANCRTQHLLLPADSF